MSGLFKNIVFVVDGFFFFFGFIDNPAEKNAKATLHGTPASKIKADLRKVNADFRKKYIELRNQIKLH